MKTAVDKVKKGKGRVVNARFTAMCAHYLFDADFCNVASAGRRAWWRRTCRTAGGASGSMPRRASGPRSPISTPGWASAAGVVAASCAIRSTFKGFSVLEMLEHERRTDAHAQRRLTAMSRSLRG
jgi:hypothetical protein